MTRWITALGLATLMAVVSGPRLAEAQNTAAAFCYLDISGGAGPLVPTATGWHWTLNCAMAGTTSRDIITNIGVDTLNGDTLATIAQKLANGVKAAGTTYGFNVSAVLLPQVVQVTPQ